MKTWQSSKQVKLEVFKELKNISDIILWYQTHVNTSEFNHFFRTCCSVVNDFWIQSLIKDIGDSNIKTRMAQGAKGPTVS